jgi:hypothetical protein
MVTLSPKLPPLPNVTVPVIDPKTGLISIEWYSWLKLVDTIVRTLRTEV